MADTECCPAANMETSTEPAQPQAEDNALSQLLSSFPGTPAADRTLSKQIRLSSYRRPSNNASSSLDPASPRPMVLRPSAQKRSRLHYSSDGFSEYDDLFLSADPKRHASNNQGEQDDLAGLQEVPDSPTETADEVMSPEEAATILLHFKQACSPAHQHLVSIQALAQDMPAHMQDAATAAAGVLAASCIPYADLIVACNDWAQHYYAQQAALDTSAATKSPGAPLRISPGPSTLPVDPSNPAPIGNNGLEKLTPQRTGSAGSNTRAGAVSPLSTSPFAALARLARQSTPAQEVLAQAVQDHSALDQTAAFANMWTQQVMTKLPHIKTKADMQQAVQAELQYTPTASAATAAMMVGLDAACDTPRGSALSTATPLRPGLLAQCLNAAADPGTPSSLAYGAPNPARAYTFENDESVFAREIVSKISPDTIADIRTHWGTTGRLSVTCGPAGRKGLSGIFTLNPAGRPVIWAPRNSSALSRLPALVAAGGGGAEVPAGYEEIEPKVFEDRAGKSKTHNWQLSIVLTDFSTIATAKCKMPNVKLGHFVRIVGIPTAKC